MLRHDVIHQMPDLGRHVPDGGAEVTDLIGTAHIYFRFQIASPQSRSQNAPVFRSGVAVLVEM